MNRRTCICCGEMIKGPKRQGLAANVCGDCLELANDLGIPSSAKALEDGSSTATATEGRGGSKRLGSSRVGLDPTSFAE